MFENINSIFNQCSSFLAAGAVFGLCYEVLRFLRMLFPHPTAVVFLEDTLFFAACGLVSFIIALWVGMGYFRIYYIAFEAIGAILYFLTLGRLINFCLRHAVRGIKKLFGKLYKSVKPVIITKTKSIFMPFATKIKALFSKIAEFVPKPTFNYKKRLQSNSEILYNNNIHSTLDSDEGGGSRNVIKAKIRKKT